MDKLKLEIKNNEIDDIKIKINKIKNIKIKKNNIDNLSLNLKKLSYVMNLVNYTINACACRNLVDFIKNYLHYYIVINKSIFYYINC